MAKLKDCGLTYQEREILAHRFIDNYSYQELAEAGLANDKKTAHRMVKSALDKVKRSGKLPND